MSRVRIATVPLAAVAAAGLMLLLIVGSASAGQSGREESGPTTPIRHVVVIFQENVSFDHYFGTYPIAANTDGPAFVAARGTPAVDGLPPATDASLPLALQHATNLLTDNPNSSNPVRLDPSAAGVPPGQGLGQLTCDQDHNYTDEQLAFDDGNMDQFVGTVGTGKGTGPTGADCSANQVMDYFDGNTVTAMWNYAQHFAMSDYQFGTTFGPSSPGAINLVSGNTGTVDVSHEANSPSSGTPNADLTPNGLGLGGYSLTNDAQPYWDDCSTRDAIAMNGPNVGDELNAAGLSWGWFQGGFRPSTDYQHALSDVGASGQSTSTFIADQFKAFFSHAANRPANSTNQALCSNVHPIGVALGGTGQYGYKDDYIAHHEPFQYYASTANPHHLTIPTDPSGHDTLAGLASIGHDTQSYASGVPQFDTPNHQYDMSDFDQLVAAIRAGELPPSALPAVSFLKAPGFRDGHAAYSDPADEQAFVTSEINALEASPDWHSTVVIVDWDDSDGWYDHAYSGVTNTSSGPADALTGSGACGDPLTAGPLDGELGRCGFGPRIPFLVISRYAKHNYVDHTLIDQSSILNFIEYNWRLSGIPGSADQVLAARDQSQGLPFDMAGMFDFCASNPKLFLDPSTGERTRGGAGGQGVGNSQGCSGNSQ
jgi:phospholipase C